VHADEGAPPPPDAGSPRDAGAAPAPASEPDYRFTLANERTFLAWQRTALGLIASGVALEEFARLSLPNALTHVLAVGAVSLGALLAVLGLLSWSRTQRAMREGRPLAVPRAIPVLAVGLALVALLIAIGLVVS
jgi:putative membrane protein